MRIKALIPVRSGSVRVKNKNIRSFANTTLLENKIKQMLRIQKKGLIDAVVVNSNSDEMLTIASSYGVECVKRDEAFALSESKINEVYYHMLSNFDAEIMLYVDCTNPLLSDEKIEQALQIYQGLSSEFDSLNSAHLVKEFLWHQQNGVNIPINYCLDKIPRSQDLPNIMALNFAINIAPTKQVLEQKSIVGLKPYLYILDEVESLDIDNEIDFEFAEFLYTRMNKILPPPLI